MPITRLAHFSVRTTDLEASRRFYTRILGFTEGFRPGFKFAGAWLYRGGDEADYGVVHLIGVDPGDRAAMVDYVGDREDASLRGGGAIDHIAFFASGLVEMRSTLRSEGLSYRERTVPDLGLHQVFFEDPSGITIELNYSATEAEAARAQA